MLDVDSDIELAIPMLTGNWYAYDLGGSATPRRWLNEPPQ